MNLHRYANPAVAISLIYAATIFFTGSGGFPLIWITVLLTALNMLILTESFFKGKSLVPGIILLNAAQTAIFCCLYLQLDNIPGAVHYEHSASPIISDWLKFIAVNMLKAADAADIADGYPQVFSGPLMLAARSIPAGLALSALYLMTGMLFFALIFKGIQGISKTDSFSAIMKWGRIGGLTIAVLLLIPASRGSTWGDRCLWPLDNILRTLDFTDFFQIFGIQLHSAAAHPQAAVFFRMMIALCALLSAYRLYSSLITGGRKSPEALAAVIVSSEYSTKDRVDAINELEKFGPFAASAVPDLIKVLISSNKTVRGAAASALRKIDDQWAQSESAQIAVPHLLNLLKSYDIGTRVGAVEVLGEFGAGAGAAVPELVNAFTDSNLTRTAAQTLLKIGMPAVPDLVSALGNEDEHIRRTVLQTLEAIDPLWQQSEEAAQKLTGFVKDLGKVDISARNAATRAIGAFGAGAAPHLVRLLTLGDVRSLALKALEEIGPEAEQKAVPYLINFIGHKDKVVRALAAAALEKISPEWRKSENAVNAIPYFVKSLQNSSEGSTEGSDDCGSPADALVEIGTASVQPLVEMMAGGRQDMLPTLLQSLKRIDRQWAQSEGAHKAVPRLIESLKNGQWFVRYISSEILGKIGPGAKKAVPGLVRLLQDPDPKVRAAAKKAMDKILLKNSPYQLEAEDAAGTETREEIASLIKQLTEGTGIARSEAAQAIGEIGPAAEEAVPHLAKALGNRDSKLRTEAAHALKRIDSQWQQYPSVQEIIPVFVKALSDTTAVPDCNMPAEALKEIGPASVRYLAEALADSNKDIVNSAAKFLEEKYPDWTRSEGAREAVPKLAESLTDSQWFVRHAAAEVLGKIGPGAIKAVPYLVKMLADKNKAVRDISKEALNKITVKV
jgi:HEAT repeat protein